MNKADLGLGLGLGYIIAKITEGDKEKQTQAVDTVKTDFLEDDRYKYWEDQIEAEILYDVLEELNFLRKETAKGALENNDLAASERLIGNQKAAKLDEYPDWHDHIEEIYAATGLYDLKGDLTTVDDIEALINKHNDRIEDLEITEEEADSEDYDL